MSTRTAADVIAEFERHKARDMGLCLTPEDGATLIAEIRRLEARQEDLGALVYDLSDALTDEGPDWSNEGLDRLRARVAAIGPVPPSKVWLDRHRARLAAQAEIITEALATFPDAGQCDPIHYSRLIEAVGRYRRIGEQG